jgi:acyltransferase-like protein
MRPLPAGSRRAPELPAPAPEAERRFHELDWLRALIILALVPAHAIGFFTATTGKYYATRHTSSISLSPLMTLGSWGMALLFFVAGAATYVAIAHRAPRQYLAERFTRLLIPCLFASLTLVPLQDYLIMHTFPDVVTKLSIPDSWSPHVADSPVTFYLWFVGAYFTFLTHYAAQYEFIFWSHLWFIPRLFLISLLTLPLLRYLRGARGAVFISWLADQCERYRGGVFLLAVPLVVVNAGLGWQWQGWEVVGAPDDANVLAQFVTYTIVFIYGYMIYASARLRHSVRRDGGAATLVVALVLFGISQLFGVGNQSLAHDYSAGGLLGGTLRAVATWLCVVSLAGLSMRILAFTNGFGRYLTEASYPFYLLHLAVLYLVGLPLLASGAPGVLSFLVMVILTYGITLALYHLLIRQVRPLTFLFGVRTQPHHIPA